MILFSDKKWAIRYLRGLCKAKLLKEEEDTGDRLKKLPNTKTLSQKFGNIAIPCPKMTEGSRDTA